jgi:polysaccharide export outer membrane protein
MQARVASLEAPTDQGTSADYRIGPEDVLEVLVWRNDALSKVVTVRPDGKISLPLIGEVEAAGLTTVELNDQITEKVKEYYKEVPTVSVIVQRATNSIVHILGEVQRPGDQTLRNGTTLLQAIASAGGFTPFASTNNILVIRGSNNNTATFKIRYKDIISGKKPDDNMILKPGDIIMVN